MRTKSQYRTRQREEVLSYLEERQGEHVTAAEVCEHFRKRGSSIGTATVYRQLERLVDEGALNKYIVDGNSPACFEYLSRDACHEGHCFHCKCEKCGALIHLHCDELEAIGAHLLACHGFRMDPRRTVFYGICESCEASSENV